jgi:chromosome segregation ATPase
LINSTDLAYRARAIPYDGLEDQLQSLRSTISNLEDEIRDADNKIARLNREKSYLQDRLQKLRGTLTQEQVSKGENGKRTDDAEKLESNIILLQGQAGTISAEAHEAVGELQGLKSNLNEMAVSIGKETEQLTSESSMIRQISLTKTARSRQCRREIAAIIRVMEASRKAQLKIPALLPASNIKLLTNEPRKEKLVSSIVLEEIPKHALAERSHVDKTEFVLWLPPSLRGLSQDHR